MIEAFKKIRTIWGTDWLSFNYYTSLWVLYEMEIFFFQALSFGELIIYGI